MPPKIRKSKAYIIWYEKQPFKAKVGDNLTTLKGRKLTLTCPALGVPKPAVSWYRGGMKMKSGKNYLVIGQTLIMYRLDPMDTDRYTCVARNFAGVKTATTTLKVHGIVLVCLFVCLLFPGNKIFEILHPKQLLWHIYHLPFKFNISCHSNYGETCL